MGNAISQTGRCINQHAVDNRGATHVGDVVLPNQRKDQRRIHTAQTHARACNQGHRPRKAPAIAMKHRQRPQIGRMVRHGPGQRIAGCIQVGAPVVRDNAFRVACSARGIAQRNCIPFVCRQLPGKLHIALGKKGLVTDLAKMLARWRCVILHLNHQGTFVAQHDQGLINHWRKFAVGQQDLGFAMLQHEADSLCIQSRVQRIQHGTRHGHPKVGFQHGWHVGQHGCNGVSGTNTAPGQRPGKLTTTGISLTPGLAPFAINHGHALWIDLGRAGQVAQRRQSDKISLIFVQAVGVGICMHLGFSCGSF